jgi:hypothetical protein
MPFSRKGSIERIRKYLRYSRQTSLRWRNSVNTGQPLSHIAYLCGFREETPNSSAPRRELRRKGK